LPYQDRYGLPVRDAEDEEIAEYNDSFAMTLLKDVIDSFTRGYIARGISEAKELTAWLEGQPMWVQAGILAELLHKVARYAPPAIGRGLLRRALAVAPRTGLWSPAKSLVHFSAAIVHRRLGNVREVLAHCRELYPLCIQEGSENLGYLPYYFESELLWLGGKYDEAFPLAEKAVALIKQHGAFDVRLSLQAGLHCAQAAESAGLFKAAHGHYREYLDAMRYGDLKPVVSILQAWDGFHRTRGPVRPKF
jgi:tetratricopeptide (TPR) repeat protein